jgi:methylmalonyl-CoA mutase
MAMVIGGTDALEVLPHDSALSMADSNAFSNRMARNIQLILAHECGFDQLVDPAGGSFYLETMTFHLAEAILLRLEAIENEMNWEDWVKKGIIELALSEQQKIKEEVNNGTLPIIGVNLYPNNQELINDPMLLEVLKKVESKFREAGDMERQTVSH